MVEFYCIKSNLFSTLVDFDTSCEICAAIIQLSLNQQLVVINVYRPPNRDLEYQQELCDCICEIVRRYPNSFIFCVGDLNLPDIDWTSNSIINYQYPLDISRFILTTAAECYFTQLVNIPTRGENILDIVFTNRPSFVNYCTVVPGVSDHDAVVVSFIAKATYQNEIKHQCYLWNRGNFVDMRVAFTEFSMYICNHYCDDMPADFLWISIKGELLNLLDKYVPSKMVSCISRQPWLNRYIKQLSRRKQRCYNWAKISNSPSAWAYYKFLKKEMQRECRKTRNSYMDKPFFDPFVGGKKKNFFRYIKSMRRDNYGIPMLQKDGITYSSDEDKAEVLNEHFASEFWS